MKKNILFLLIFVVSVSCKTYKLPDAKMKPSKVCGYDYCQPGNFGIVFQFFKKPHSPDVTENINASDIAYSFIGHTFPETNLLGDQASSCSITSSNPFSKDDIVNIANPTGRAFDYERKEKLNLSIEASTKANMDELRKFTSDADKLVKLEAEIKSAYSRINGSELNVIGKYSEWGLKKNSLDKLIKGDGFVDCKKFLVANKYRIITAIGMVYYDITFNQNSIDALSTEIQSKVEKEGIKANIAFTFKREVSQTLKATTKGGFQIVVWRTAGYYDLTLN